MAKKVELAEAVDYVASQLLEAEEKAARRSRRTLELADVELELVVTVEKKGGGGIMVYVVELGADVQAGQTQRIKVRFKPHGEPAAFETGEGEGKTKVTYGG